MRACALKPHRLESSYSDVTTRTLFCFNISRFEANDNAIIDCSLTCFDGSEDLHEQDGKLVIKIYFSR